MLASLHSILETLLPRWVHKRLMGEWGQQGFNKYFKNTGWHLIMRLSTLVIAFFTTIYVIRYLGPENYGTLSYAVSFISLFSFLASFGIDQIVLRELIKRPTEEATLMGSAFFLKVIGGAVAAILSVAGGLLFNASPIEIFLITLLSLTHFAGAGQIAVYVFQARVVSKYPALISITVSLILAIAKLLVIFFDKGIIYFALILVLETILYTLFYFAMYQRKYHLLGKWRVDAKTVRALMLNSWPLMLSTVSIIIYSRIDQVMLRHFMDLTAVGMYDAAVRLSDVWYIIPNIILGALFPAIINARTGSLELFRKRIWLCAALLASLSAFIIIPTTFLAPYIIEILFGASFADSASVLTIYIWSLIGFSLGQLINIYLISENYIYVYLFTSVTTVLVNVGLNILLIPTYGINGAAIATLISYSLIPLLPFGFKKIRLQLLALKFDT